MFSITNDLSQRTGNCLGNDCLLRPSPFNSYHSWESIIIAMWTKTLLNLGALPLDPNPIAMDLFSGHSSLSIFFISYVILCMYNYIACISECIFFPFFLKKYHSCKLSYMSFCLLQEKFPLYQMAVWKWNYTKFLSCIPL